MAQMLSPGVYIEEIDASAITPSTSANVAFLAASFTDGPIEMPYVVTNKTEYVDTFGQPTDRNYNEWFQGYKFFDYGNQLVVTRAGMERRQDFGKDISIEIGTETPIIAYYDYKPEAPPLEPDLEAGREFFTVEPVIDDPDNPPQYFEKLEIILKTDPQGVINKDQSMFLSSTYQFPVEIFASPVQEPNGYKIVVQDTRPPRVPGDDTTIGFSQDEVNSLISLSTPEEKAIYPRKALNIVEENVIKFITEREPSLNVALGDWIRVNYNTLPGKVIKIAYHVDTTDPDNIKKEYYIYVEFNIQPGDKFQDATDLNLPLNGDIYPALLGHINGGTQAFTRGAIQDDTSDPSNPVRPENPNALDLANIDVPVYSNGIKFRNPNRSNYFYNLIKNDSEFQYQYDTGELHRFSPGMKLKFFTRTASEEKIEVAIANYYDFWTDQKDNSNFAVAFEDNIGGHVQRTYLRSLFEYTPLPDEFAVAIKKGKEIETFIVSLNPLSVDGNNKSNYIETVINESSKLVYVLNNIAINDFPATYLVQDRFGTPKENKDGAMYSVPTSTLIVQGGRDPVPNYGAYQKAYETVLDKERYEIDVIIGVERFFNIAIDLADRRKDCIAYVGTRYQDSVGYKANDAVNKILTWKKGRIGNPTDAGRPTTTMFAALFANYFRIFDSFNKKHRWINVAGDMAGIRCDVTSNNAPWWVSAGMKRGKIRNITKLAFTPNQEQRDNMYKESINPIVTFPGTGNLVWGNKTLHPIASSFDRINVRTLFNTLERSMAKAARSQVFEFNDPYTRNAMMAMFNPYLATIKAGRGIVDYLVICDESNNTPDVISRNELRVDIYIKPNYAAEMILLTFTNVGTRSFADVVGVN